MVMFMDLPMLIQLYLHRLPVHPVYEIEFGSCERVR